MQGLGFRELRVQGLGFLTALRIWIQGFGLGVQPLQAIRILADLPAELTVLA